MWIFKTFINESFHNSRLITWIQQNTILSKIARLLTRNWTQVNLQISHSKLLSVLRWDYNGSLIHAWVICPIHVIHLHHLIGRKSLHFEKTRKSCSIDSRNEQSATCKVVHETSKAHFRNLQPNRFVPSSLGRALEWWSEGHGFKPHWWQFLMKFILFCVTLDLSDNLTEMS